MPAFPTPSEELLEFLMMATPTMKKNTMEITITEEPDDQSQEP